MSRARAARPPLPSREVVRVEQRGQRRDTQRAGRRGEQSTPPAPTEAAASSKRRARKKLLKERRKLAARLPRTLSCTVRISGAGGPTGMVGARAAFLRTPRWGVTGGGVTAGLLGAVLVKAGGPMPGDVPGIVILSVLTVLFVGAYLRALRRMARQTIPAELSVLPEEVQIAWEGGATLTLPLGEVDRVDVPPLVEVVRGRVTISSTSTPATAVITRGDGAVLRVDTTSVLAHRLAAAVEVARGDLAGRLASQIHRRPAARRESAPVSSAPPPAPPPPAAPPPNEAALSSLDRDGRPLDAWRQALRAAFADTGYRRAPPLHPDDLLHIVADPRVAAERRVGAALALTERADEQGRERLRIASATLETEALRVAVENASYGILEEEALEQAITEEAQLSR